MKVRRGIFFLLVLPHLAVGCAGLQRPDRPQDFPLRSLDHPLVDLHWRLDRRDGEVRATGVVEATRQGSLEGVILELRGIDRVGRVVSRALGRTYSGALDRWDNQPFVVRLRPTGQEERFELGVWTYVWMHSQGGRGG
jgi:hypothetical protein